ncbi:site-specific integrase [Bacillus sp. C1]
MYVIIKKGTNILLVCLFLLEKGKRETTIKDYIRHMTNFEKWLRSEGSSLKKLTRYDVQQYIKYVQDKGNKATTIHPKFSSIVAYSQYCQKLYLVENIQHPGIRQIAMIRQYREVKPFDEQAHQLLLQSMQNSVLEKDEKSDIINVAIAELVKNSYELPAFHTLIKTVNHVHAMAYRALY